MIGVHPCMTPTSMQISHFTSMLLEQVGHATQHDEVAAVMHPWSQAGHAVLCCAAPPCLLHRYKALDKLRTYLLAEHSAS
jgi:hypothetical protein